MGAEMPPAEKPAARTTGDEMPDADLDPKVAELVTVIRDRFGLRGLRGARWMIENEIALAEDVIAELASD